MITKYEVNLVKEDDDKAINTHFTIDALEDYEAKTWAFLTVYREIEKCYNTARETKKYFCRNYKSAETNGDEVYMHDMAKEAAQADYSMKTWKKIKNMMDNMADEVFKADWE